MDNFSSHSRAAVRERIEATGANQLFLPPYRPDFNPIKKNLPEAQSPFAQSRQTHRLGLLGTHRKARRHLHTKRMRKLFQLVCL